MDDELNPDIEWLAVQPRHYADAQAIKKSRGHKAYVDYILSLVSRLDGRRTRERPLQKVVRQIVAAFEANFRPKEEGARDDS